MTKQNPRPRKYASDAERQAAYRTRAAEVCVRLEPKTMATLDSIAEEIGYSRNELMQSMVKFGLTNRDWRNEGLTAHKRLPRYQENPMATKPPSAAQLAARARFAEMARSGVLNRKRQIAAKKSAGVKRKTNPTTDVKWDNYLYGPPKGIIGIVDGAQVLIFPIKKSETDKYDMPEWARAVVEILPSKTHEEAHFPAGSVQNGKDNAHRFVANAKNGRKSNPAKKTVSQKISQLVHEGYSQRQAVAVALNEQRKGKVKRNPASGLVKGYAVVCMHPNPHTVAITTSMSEAKKIGQDYATRENVQVAIKPVDVHAGHFA